MTSIIGRNTIRKDIENFCPIIERIYGSGPRLINAKNSLTCSISDVLSASVRKECSIQLIQDAVDLQLKHVESGGRTVAVMVVLWYKCAVDLIEQGVGKNIVLIVLNSAIEDCVKIMSSFGISTQDINLRDLCKGLSHGCNDWKLVYNAVEMLNQFKSSKQIVVLYEKSIKASFVHRGLLVSFPGNVDKVQRIVLVCGDICSGYHHTGYKGLVKEAQIYTPDHNPALWSKNNPALWSEKIKTLLKSLQITSILMSGKIDQDISHYCDQNKISVISVSYDMLGNVAEVSEVEMLPYLDACTVMDVGEVMFERADDGWISVTNGGTEFVSIVLRSCTQIKGCVEMVKSVVCRVKGALNNNFVLPGGGDTEKKIVQNLCCHGDVIIKDSPYPEWMLEDMKLYKMMIYERFSATLLRTEHLAGANQSDIFDDLNFDKFDNFSDLSVETEHVVYDVMSVKVSAWRRAFELTRILLNTDLAIKPPPPSPE